jgi:hypothetical protein
MFRTQSNIVGRAPVGLVTGSYRNAAGTSVLQTAEL